MSRAKTAARFRWLVKTSVPEPARILVVSPQPFYEDRGTPIAVRQLLHALAELGYRTDLLTYPIGSSPDVPGARYVRCANPFRFRSVPVGFSLRKLILDVALVVRMAGLVRRERYQAIHALEESAFPAALVARWLGIPLVYDMQSSLPEQLTKHWLLGTRPLQAALLAFERWLVRRADQIVGSAGLAPRIHRVVPGKPFREWTFYSGPRPVVEPAEVDQLRRHIGVDPGRKMVLYSGTFADYQGVDLLLGAASEICRQRDDVDFVLVGGYPQEQREVRRAAARLQLGERLRVLARHPRDQMPALLQAADVLVSPRSFGGNLPLKVFDYLAAGRPIVATDIATHRTVLDERCAVLVPPDAAGLARGIGRLLDDPAAAAALGEAAHAVSVRRYGWQSFVGVVADLYAEAFGSAPADPRVVVAAPVALQFGGSSVRSQGGVPPSGPELPATAERPLASGTIGF
jgi:glycosyltransferase involved in cell wall biosynthesis